MSGKNRTGTISGRKIGEGNIGIEAMRLYKTQDAGYLRTMTTVVSKEVDRLKETLEAAKGAQGTTIKFVDEHPQKEAKDDDESLDDEDEDDEDDKETLTAEERAARNRRNLQAKQRARLENRLSMAKKRQKALLEAEQALDFQRAKSGKSPTVGGVNKHGKKFKIRERKR